MYKCFKLKTQKGTQLLPSKRAVSVVAAIARRIRGEAMPSLRRGRILGPRGGGVEVPCALLTPISLSYPGVN